MILLNRSLIYPFPAVQYIPINMNIQVRFAPSTDKPQIKVGSKRDGILDIIRRNDGIEIESSQITDDDGIIVATGLEFKEALYRAFYLTILGATQAGGFLATFPLKYFYKNPIVIQVRSEAGDLLASSNFNVPANTSKYLR